MLQRVFLHRTFLGPTKMRHQDNTTAIVENLTQGRNCCFDPCRIRYFECTVEGYIEIDTDEGAFTLEIKTIDSRQGVIR